MRTYFVDSFTDEPFKGNPAAVCLLQEDIGETRMQQVATEIGFSETAFVKAIENDNTYSIRFFSPKTEIPLCGHATLASAKVLVETTGVNDVRFLNVQNIELYAKRNANGEIEMVFPIYDTTPLEAPSAMLIALGIEGVNQTSYSTQNKIVVLEIEDVKVLAALKPDYKALLHSYDNINGVLVTAPSRTSDYDFHYRYFWPWAGTDEDPVTGGVQTFLAKYWSLKLGKNVLKAFQSSKRTGHMKVELLGDKVLISGNAVILLEGEFKIFY